MSVTLKLRTRLLIGYAVPVGLFVGIAGMVYGTANDLSNTFKEVNRVQNSIIQLDQMALKGMGMIRASRGYLIKADPAFLQEYQTEYKDFQNAANIAKDIVKDEEQKKRYLRMVELAKEYDVLTEKIVDLQNKGKRAELLSLFSSGQGVKIIEDFNRLNREFNQAETSFLEKKMSAANNNLQNLLLAVMFGVGLVLVLAVFVAITVSTNVEKTISKAVNTIATSSSEIVTAVEEQERTVNHQVTAVHQTTSTMDELGVSSRQSAERAESTRVQVEQIAGQIKHLSEQVNQIDKIANLVSDLANQTNMLAINAAVEAVRAGDHGKGFGVVAGEIRKLADQSKRSAEKINDLVGNILEATNSAMVISNEGNKSFESIVAAVNNIALNAQQISLSAKQQAIAIEQVVEAMNNLNHSAQQTATSIAQTRSSVQNLNTTAKQLNEEV